MKIQSVNKTIENTNLVIAEGEPIVHIADLPQELHITIGGTEVLFNRQDTEHLRRLLA